MTIFQVVEYGPICAADEDTGWLVTVNGAYVNLWVPCGDGWVPGGDGSYTNTDLEPTNAGSDGLHKMTGAQMLDRAKECLTEWLNPKEED